MFIMKENFIEMAIISVMFFVVNIMLYFTFSFLISKNDKFAKLPITYSTINLIFGAAYLINFSYDSFSKLQISYSPLNVISDFNAIANIIKLYMF